MNHKYFVLPAIISASLCFAACNKTVEPATPSVPQSNGLTNSLIKYVPSDTPLLLASTRNFNIDTGINGVAIKPLINALKVEFSDMQKRMAQRIHEKNEMNETDEHKRIRKQQFIQSVDSIIKLYADYKSNYAEWGLDPNGYNDYVAYIGPHNDLVLKFAVADSDKFKAKLDTINFIKQFYNSEESGDDFKNLLSIDEANIDGETWIVYNGSGFICGDINLVKDSGKPYLDHCLDYDKRTKPVKYEVENDDEDSALSDEDDKFDSPMTYFAFAANYKDNVVTFVPMLSVSSAKTLNDHLKPVPSPITSEQYAGLKNDVMALAYTNNLEVYRLIVNSEMNVASLAKRNKDLTPEEVAKKEETGKKAEDFLAKFPTIQAYVRMNNSEVIEDLIVNVSDLEVQKRIRDIVVSTPAMDKTSIFGLRIGANFEIMSQLISEKLRDMGKEEGADSWDEIAMYSQGLYGLNIDLKKLDILEQKKGSYYDGDGRVIIYGPETGSLLSMLYNFASKSDSYPELNQARTWGLYDEFELYHYLPNLNEYLTQNSYTLATNSYKISESPAIEPESYIMQIHVTRKMIDILYPFLEDRFMRKAIPYCTLLGYDADDDECKALPKRFLALFKENAELNMSIGIEEDGFRYTQSFDLHYNDESAK